IKLVKAANKDAKALILIWDNFASHKADKVIKAAEKEDIYLLFLPAYAPDLNPIEFIWKEVKRSIGEEIFIPDKPTLKNAIFNCFNDNAINLSFAKDWILNILWPVTNKLKMDFSHLFCG